MSTNLVCYINIVNTNNTYVIIQLDHFINKYEKQLLTEVLGLTLYNSFKAGLAEVSVPQIWTDLKTGVDYTDLNGKSRHWRGIISTAPKESLIANYVYYWYQRNNHTQTASTGETKGKQENADMASMAVKLMRAWNEMSEWICELIDYLDAKED